MKREDLELYAMGEYDGDAAAFERALADDAAARAVVADEARFELMLRDAAAAAAFCAACDDLVRGARCDACGAAVRPGGYVVERVLVSNAHGRMYAARDADGKQVALKELAFVQSPTVEVIAAFEREVKFLRALEHPAIPRFCASFEEGSGVHARYYLAQELVAGQSLEDRLDTHWFREAEVVSIARQVLDVLVYLQGLSPMVIHRDIKPANLVVRGDGAIAVVDFGAAHVQGTTAGSTTIGTFGYMPIEQLAGEVDATTDPYALGASLLHLLTRREPWRILQGGELAAIDLNVSRPLRAFLTRLVAPRPADRFASAAEARAALDRAAGGGPVREALQRVPRPRGRSWLSAVAAGAVLLTAMGGAFGLRAHRKAARARSAEIDLRMSRFRDEMCQCGDRRCIDDVSRRMTAWIGGLPGKGRGAPDLSAAQIKQVAVVSASIATCAARVMIPGAPSPPPLAAPGAPPLAAPGDPAPATAPGGRGRAD